MGWLLISPRSRQGLPRRGLAIDGSPFCPSRSEPSLNGDVSRRSASERPPDSLSRFSRAEASAAKNPARRPIIPYGRGDAPNPDRPAARDPAASRAAQEQARTRSEEHTSELQSLMRISYAVFCLKKKKQHP